jgi:predicted nucleic acid-binding Zn ribbon protein
MSEVDCLYCGARIPDDSARCPQCGAPSHFQQRGYRAGALRRFVLLFAILTIAAFVMAFWLPR